MVTPYLLTLANRNNPICVASPKVAKASTIVIVACHCSRCNCLKYNVSVNYPLGRLPKALLCIVSVKKLESIINPSLLLKYFWLHGKNNNAINNNEY